MSVCECEDGKYRFRPACSPVYVSPERGRAVEGARARKVDYAGYDAWAFGLTLHRMLGGPAGGGMAVPRRRAAWVHRRRVRAPARRHDRWAAWGTLEYARAAGAIVRGLLRVDPAVRCSLRDAVARLEALAFLLLPAPGGGGAGGG